MQESRSMQPAGAAVARSCGARTRSGGLCKRPRGWGTNHVGTGRCKNHGGSSPTGQKAAASEELAGFMAAAGPLMDVDPATALVYAVQRASGIAAWLRRKVAGVEEGRQIEGGELNVWARLETESIDRLARYSKMALDAGVNERRVRMAERAGEAIALALEEALAAETDLSAPQRARLAQAFATRLAVHEATTDDEMAAA